MKLKVILLICILLSYKSLQANQAYNEQETVEKEIRTEKICCKEPLIEQKEGPCLCMPSTGRPLLYRPLEFARVAVIPYGFVKLDAFYDTRQVIGDREEQFLFFPAPYLPDKLNQDVNAHGHYRMTAIETRIGVSLKGPRRGEYVLNGGIEGDFRGVNELAISGFKMRLAFGSIEWPTGSFVFGEYWHPLFVHDCYPDTVSFNNGGPMDPQARMPQFRLTQHFKELEFIASVSSQRIFESPGPDGLSSKYIANSKRPDLTIGLRYYFGENFIGLVVDHKWLTPRLVSDVGYKVCERFGSTIGQVYASCTYAPVSVRVKAIYAENGSEQLLISGYGVRTRDPLTGEQTYANTRAVAAWVDSSYLFHCNRMELGLFAGYTQNIGSRHALYRDLVSYEPIIYTFAPGLADRLEYVARISSRWVWSIDPFRLGVEVEWTRASFGTPNTYGRVCNGKPVDNVRILGGFYFVF